MKKKYEIVIKNLDGDWETFEDNIKTLKQAIMIAKKIPKRNYLALDINLIIDDDLKETFDRNGKMR